MIIDEPEEIVPGIPVEDETTVSDRRYKALLITGICLSVMVYPYLSYLVSLIDTNYFHRLFCSPIVEWAMVGILYLFAQKAELNKFLLWQEKRYNAGFYILSVILLYLLVFAAQWVSFIPHLLGYHEDNALLKKVNAFIQGHDVLIIVMAVTAGITEEFIFRGYVLSRLSLFFKNRHWPVIISALVFTVIHLGYKSLGEVIFVFLFGMIFGYYYQKYRNLAVLMIVHALTDYIAFSIHHPHK